MRYVALLRGINVGGKNKIDMAQLKEVINQLGFSNVSTYINTGNVLFEDTLHTLDDLQTKIQRSIIENFKLDIAVLVCSYPQMQDIVTAIPDDWENNHLMKSDVLFLFKSVDRPDIINEFNVNHDLIAFKYTPGAVILNLKKETLIKSRLSKLCSQSIYKNMTIRNVTTTRTIFEKMQA